MEEDTDSGERTWEGLTLRSSASEWIWIGTFLKSGKTKMRYSTVQCNEGGYIQCFTEYIRNIYYDFDYYYVYLSVSCTKGTLEPAAPCSTVQHILQLI